MEFRSYADLARTLSQHLTKVPEDVDLIVAIPRSGIVPATILALGLDLPTTDVEGLLAGRIDDSRQMGRFRRMPRRIADCRHALVIDDSVLSGNTLVKIKQRLAAADLPMKLSYAAVYATEASAPHVDLYFEICPNPRLFEWNYLHHKYLGRACLELDQIILPIAGRVNGDGRFDYAAFLRDAVPQVRPSHLVHHLVSSIPAAHRSELEAWLHQHQIHFTRLSLRSDPAEDPLPFKLRVFKGDDESTFLIGAEAAEAATLAEGSGKPVICFGDQRLHLPPAFGAATLQQDAKRFCAKGLRVLQDWLRLGRMAPGTTT